MSSQLSQSNDAYLNRYASLVQPIKDLAANWDIDIAENLGEYLEELDQLRITMDGGQTQLNFAEAALLIQGSTAIYSKKVEYLHQLVLKSLEFITQRKSGKNKENNSDNNKNTDLNDRTYDEDFLLNFGDLSEPKDLLLDHLIEEGENIDLPANANNNNTVQKGRFYVNDKDDINASMDSLGGKSQSNVSRVSVSLLHSLLQDGSTSGSGASLRLLSSAYLDQSGALLLGAFRPSYFKPLSSSTINTNNSNGMHSNASNLFSAVDSAVSAGNMNTHDAADAEDMINSGGEYHNEGHHYDYDDALYDTPADGDTDTAPPLTAILPSTAAPPVAVQHQYIVTSLPKTGSPAQFQLLDPHTVLPGSRPVAKGRPYRMPSKLQLKKEQEETMKHAVKRCLLLPVYAADPAMQLLFPSDTTVNESQKKKREKLLPVKGLLEPQLLPLLQLKRKLQKIRRMKLMRVSRQQQAIQHSVLDECVWEHPGGIAAAGGVSQDTLYHNMNANNDNVNNDYDNYDDNDHFYPDYQTEDMPHEVEDAEDLAQRSQQIEAALYNNRVVSSGHPYDIDDELVSPLAAAGHTYEMLCRQYLEGFQRGADAFARETQLSMRVATWTQKLEPVLLKQEEEKPFDIHEYSDSVLHNLSHLTLSKIEEQDNEEEKEVEVGFAEVVAGKSSGEVCRVFLACLQLANLGNVDVIRPLDMYKDCDNISFDNMAPFQLKLLKEERDNKDMNSFQNNESFVDENYDRNEVLTMKKIKGATNAKRNRGKPKKTTFVI